MSCLEGRCFSGETLDRADDGFSLLATSTWSGLSPPKYSNIWAISLLRGAISANRGEMDLHTFTELVGVQMLLMSYWNPSKELRRKAEAPFTEGWAVIRPETLKAGRYLSGILYDAPALHHLLSGRIRIDYFLSATFGDEASALIMSSRYAEVSPFRFNTGYHSPP